MFKKKTAMSNVANVEKASDASKHQVYVIKGVEGDSVYLNHYRIGGPKPWGGGPILRQWEVSDDDLIKSYQLHPKLLHLQHEIKLNKIHDAWSRYQARILWSKNPESKINPELELTEFIKFMSEIFSEQKLSNQNDTLDKITKQKAPTKNSTVDKNIKKIK